MELRELRSLLALAERGSITKVGAQLYLTPAAIHKHLKALEAEFGVPLYERIGGRLELTPQARAILPQARELLAQYEATIEAVTHIKEMRRGLLRIGAGPSISSHILPGILLQYRDRYPEIDLQVETGASVLLTDLLENGRIDLAMLVSAPEPANSPLVEEVSFDFEIVGVGCSTRYPSRKSLAQLRNESFILYREGSRVEALIDAYFIRHRFAPKAVMRSDNTESLRAMAIAGLGIAMLPYWAIDEDIKKNRLRRVLRKEEPLIGQISLLRRGGRFLSSPTSAFVEIAKQCSFRAPRLRT
ncbi:MAG: LysR family transcriptional regulator [Bryobacterales bacterium]|jgi:LysR family transcriptional activator of glutamate synthase operon|nr:LysR family transcriptional regulator [Bryobacterales bacterium]